MSVDATTQAALEGQILNWRALIYADFDGDVLRVTTGLYDKTVSGSGDSELDGTYESVDHNAVQISSVKHDEGGSGTVTFAFSGLIVNNLDFLTLIGDRANWQGRVARLWFYCVDDDEDQVGEIIPYYTGYMDALSISGSPESQTVAVTIENYLASIAGASGKTYLMQDRYDSGDLSAAASISAANSLVGAGVGTGQGAGALPDEGAKKPKKNKSWA